MKFVRLMGGLLALLAVGSEAYAVRVGWRGWGSGAAQGNRAQQAQKRCVFDKDDMSTNTFALFYDSDSKSEKRAFEKVRSRARKRDADIDFVLINVEKNKYVGCENAYNLDEIPTVAFFENGDTDSYSVLEGDDITSKRLTRFVERNTGVRLRKRERDYDDDRPRSRVHFGIGIGAPYWGRGYYGGYGGWGGWGRRGWYGRRGHRGHHGHRR